MNEPGNPFAFARRNQEMNMVGHEGVAVQECIGGWQCLGDEVAKGEIIAVVSENQLAIVPPVDNMDGNFRLEMTLIAGHE